MQVQFKTMKSVAVLCFGAHTDPWVFEALDEGHADWAQHAFDVALNLKDPLEDDRVHHTQNGMHGKTMIAVMGQRRFSETAGTILDHVAAQADKTYGLLIPIYCKKGMHRSDVVSRFIAEALNEIEYQGEKLFNIQLFSLNESSCLRDKRHAVSQAIRWVTHGWEAPPMPTAKVRYGTVECRSRENASKHCGSAWAHVDYLQNYLNEKIVTKSLDAGNVGEPEGDSESVAESAIDAGNVGDTKSVAASAVDAGNVGEPEGDQDVQQDSLPSGQQSRISVLAPTVKMQARHSKRKFEATRHNKLNRFSIIDAIIIDRRPKVEFAKQSIVANPCFEPSQLMLLFLKPLRGS